MSEDWPDVDDEFDHLDEWEDAQMQCGELFEGGCTLAGTEHCDFRCPFRDSMLSALRARDQDGSADCDG